MIKEDGSVIHFDSPEVQASTDAKTFAVLGHSESMQLSQRMSGLVSQLSSEDSDQLTHLVITLPTSKTLSNVLPSCLYDIDATLTSVLVSPSCHLLYSCVSFPAKLSGIHPGLATALTHSFVCLQTLHQLETQMIFVLSWKN